jgi:hypothetical protein
MRARLANSSVVRGTDRVLKSPGCGGAHVIVGLYGGNPTEAPKAGSRAPSGPLHAAHGAFVSSTRAKESPRVSPTGGSSFFWTENVPVVLGGESP